MQPLINLKSFLAVLLILIVPVALLVAYFRNYSPEAGGHEHSEMAKRDGAAMGKDGDKGALKPGGDSHAAMGHGTMPKPQGGQMQPQQQAETSQPPAAQPQKEGGHAAMGHGNTAQPSTAQSQPQQVQPKPPGAAADASAPTSAGSPRSMKAMPSMGEGAEPAGMQAMGSVKNLMDSGKGTEVVSRLFHAGAKDFFLDHAQHLTLSTEQQKRLNQIKEEAALNKASAGRKVQEAEQQLWKSTASDQPNPAEIETKVREVEKLRADQRLVFIRTVGEAAKVLTEEQTKILLGTAAPAMPDAKPATPGSKPTAKPAAEPAHQHKP